MRKRPALQTRADALAQRIAAFIHAHRPRTSLPAAFLLTCARPAPDRQAGGNGGASGAGSSGSGSDTDASGSGDGDPCELCGRTFPHEHIRAMYRGGSGGNVDGCGSDSDSGE